jgi:superfamily II DNA/RNA helicase
LLQVKTGEGKSLITAMLAATQVLLNKKPVDVITSSSVLAKRDANTEGQRDFYNMLGISCGHNCTKQYQGFKECYSSDVVYGDSLSFQSDYLRTVFKGDGLRGERAFASVIVDEVDSMLIDESAKIAKLATPICGIEHLETMFILVSKQIENLGLSSEDLDDKELISKLKEQITSLAQDLILPSSEDNESKLKVIVPRFLHDFVGNQSKNWASSALLALKMKENVDYVITLDENNEKIIAPVDYSSTGIVQKSTSWGNGLHQFLQIKHRLRITPESLTTSFISNMSYFKLYGNNICGISGTLGGNKEKQLLEKVYKIDTAIIPTFKPKIFKRYEDRLLENDAEHKNAIIESSISEAKAGRGVLVICETITEGREIAKNIRDLYSNFKVKEYLRSDDNNSDSELSVRPRDIIVATNLAGRGTDIKTSKEVEDGGGLHVIVSFMPKNLRVEEQALGRTSRQGNKGSGELILNASAILKKYREYGVDIGIIDKEISSEGLRLCRDRLEEFRLERDKNLRLKHIKFEDKLFKRFNKDVYQPLKQDENNKTKLLQLEDLWGFWLVRQKITPSKIANEESRAEIVNNFEEFAKKVKERYAGNGIIENPAYMTSYVQNTFGEGPGYSKQCDLLREIDSFDPIYSYQLHNMRAYVYLRHNGTITKQSENSTKWRQEYTGIALNSLNRAYGQIQNVVLPQLQSSLLLLGADSNNTPLAKQLDNKIRLLDTASKSIKENIDYIVENNRPGKNTMTIGNILPQTYRDLFSSEVSIDDIREFERFGMTILYRASSVPYKKDYISGTIVAIAGVAQVVVGAIIAVGSGGFAAEFGISLAAGGISDVISGIRAASKGQEIPLNAWVHQKGIELALNLAMAGISAATASKQVTKEVVKQGVKDTATKLTLQEFGKQLAIKVATMEVTKLGTEYVTGKVSDIFAHEIKAQIKETKTAIRDSFYNEPTKSNLDRICTIDESRYAFTQEHVYREKFSKAVLSVLDRKSSEFAVISQRLLTHMVGSAVANRGGSIGSGLITSTTVNLISSGVSSYQGIEEVRDLKSYIISEIQSTASEVKSNLPSFELMLQERNRALDKDEAAQIKQILEQHKVLQSDLIIDDTGIKKVGSSYITSQKELSFNKSPLEFISGLQELIIPSIITSNTGSQISGLGGDQTIVTIPFELQELQETGTTNSLTIENIDLGKLNYVALHVQELLRDIVKASQENYDHRIDETADLIAGSVESRMHGLIKAKVISPITGALVGAGVSSLVDWAKNFDWKKTSRINQVNGLALGVSAGDVIEEDEQYEEEDNDIPELEIQKPDSKSNTIDISPDKIFLENLLSPLTLDQDSEIAKMLKNMREQIQDEPKLVPIFDSSNKTRGIPKTSNGFSLINSAYASSFGATAIASFGSELPWLEAASLSGARSLAPYLFSTAVNVAKHVPSATFGAGIAVGLHNAAKFEAEHPWVGSNFDDIMNNPLVPQSTKDEMWQQMRNDPLIRGHQSSLLLNVKTLPTIDFKVMGRIDNQSSNTSINSYFDIDPNAGNTLITPPYQPKSILLDDQARYVKWHELMGFSSAIVKAHKSSVVIANDENSDDSGICKVQTIYSADDPNTKKITAKQRIQMENIPMYGLNPGNIQHKGDTIFVDTELLGGVNEARECFKNLAGFYPESMKQVFTKPDGTVIVYRALGKSGHSKVEINDKMSNKIFEKITFVNKFNK